MLSIRTMRDLVSHPRIGASWEGYVIEEALQLLQPEQRYFWATHNGAELDLFMVKDGRRTGIECKFQDAPRVTPSMRTAIKFARSYPVLMKAMPCPITGRAEIE